MKNHMFDKKYFEGKTTNNYFRMFRSIAGSKMYWGKRTSLIKSILSKGRVLDIGCAYGHSLKYLNGDYDKYGIDISEHAIEKCRHQEIDAAFNVLDFEDDIGWLDGKKFDLIMCFQVLEHFKDPMGELRKIKSLLKDGGYLFMSVPVSKDCYFERFFRKIDDNDPTHIHHHRSREYWRRIVILSGFDIVDDWSSLYDELIWFRGLTSYHNYFNRFGNFQYILAK